MTPSGPHPGRRLADGQLDDGIVHNDGFDGSMTRADRRLRNRTQRDRRSTRRRRPRSSTRSSPALADCVHQHASTVADDDRMPARLPRHSCSPRRRDADPPRHSAGANLVSPARGPTAGVRRSPAGSRTLNDALRRRQRHRPGLRRPRAWQSPAPREADEPPPTSCSSSSAPAAASGWTSPTDKTAAGQSCTDDTQAQTDATAIAVLQLAVEPGTGSVAIALTKAKAWLVTQQTTTATGWWHQHRASPTPTAPGWLPWRWVTGRPAALGGGGTVAARTPGDRLRHLRQARRRHRCDRLRRCTARPPAAANGITVGTQDQWRRATSQAVPALAYLPRTPPRPPRSSPDPAAT